MDDPIADAGQDLLLSSGPGEVALAGGLPHSRVRERLLAVEMVTSLRDREPAGEAVFVVGRVAEGAGDVDVDPADGVDDPDEAAQVHRRVVRDVEAEQLSEGAAQHVEAGPV